MLPRSNAAPPSPASLIAALVLVAVVPAVGVLWFMTVAMRNERLAVQERLADVYSSHLTSLQRQVNSFWQARQTALQADGHATPAERFAANIRAKLADSVVVYDHAGRTLYPSPLVQQNRAEESGDWAAARELEFQKGVPAAAAAAYARIAQASSDIHIKARAWQAQAGCLLKAGRKEDALTILAELTRDPVLRDAANTQGTLIGPNAWLLILKSLGPVESGAGASDRAALQPALNASGARAEAPRYGEASPEIGGADFGRVRQQALDALAARLNDYTGATMPSSQRRFLMREMKVIAPDVAVFPTLDAEDLAVGYVDREPARAEVATGAVGASFKSAEVLAKAEPRDETVSAVGTTFSRHDAAPTTDPAETASEVSRPAGAKLQRTALAKVWNLPSSDGRLVALWREERLKNELAAWLAPFVLPEVHVTVLPPGERDATDKRVPSLDAGEFMPGWRLALSFNGADPLASASQRQSRIYLWIGFLVVLLIAVLALLVARMVAAQLRLARLKNELVSTVSHELKTPLASMRALVDTLAAGRFRDEQQLREYLQLIGKENLRLSHLIENFLTFSRMERGQQRFRFEALAPAAVLGAAVDVLKEKLASPACRFELHVGPDLPRIRGDAEALATVLINLLENACKYTNGDKRIAARVRRDRDAVWFEIEDNGIGLAPDETRKIFDRFYQVDQSLTRQRGGCGLGLSIVKFIVEAHRGAVEVKSAPGQGSTFRVRIPVATPNV